MDILITASLLQLSDEEPEVHTTQSDSLLLLLMEIPDDVRLPKTGFV